MSPPPPAPPTATSSSSSSSNVRRDPNPRYPDISHLPVTPDPEAEERRYSAATTLESFEMQVLHSSIFDESMARTRLRMMKIVAGLPTDPTQPPTPWATSGSRAAKIPEAENSSHVGSSSSAAAARFEFAEDEEEGGPSRSGPGRGIGTVSHARNNYNAGLDQMFDDDEG